MQRRDFITGLTAAGLAASCQNLSSAEPAAQAAGQSAAKIDRAADDRFVLSFAPAQARPLRILQLTDTHFGNDDPLSKLQDQRSFKEIAKLVENQRPDLVVHTGDFINNDKGPSTSFEAIEVFNSLGVPWTHALGNHDIGHRSVPEFRQPMKNASVGHFRAGDSEHYAFRFDVVTPGSSTPRFHIYCFDSGFRGPNRRVSGEQLQWFDRQMADDARQGMTAPAVAMIHIPVVEFETMRAANKQEGNFGERVCSDDDHGDTFGAFKKSNRMRAVFSGHDHKNDYHGLWDGIELVYGRVSGWSAYGELKRGGRLIELDLNGQVVSHRLVFPGDKAAT